jgi:hypothetical protein
VSRLILFVGGAPALEAAGYLCDMLVSSQVEFLLNSNGVCRIYVDAILGETLRLLNGIEEIQKLSLENGWR